MTEQPTPELVNRLLDKVLDSRYREEPIHEKDCPACDLAAETAGTIACCWDPNETWYEVEAPDGLPGDTLLDQLVRLIAFDLHRRLLGHAPQRRRSL